MKYLSLLCCILIFAACQTPSCDNAAECKQFTPPAPNEITCQMYVKGYYYNTKTNTCTYYEGSACNQPPFQKLEECIACECS